MIRRILTNHLPLMIALAVALLSAPSSTAAGSEGQSQAAASEHEHQWDKGSVSGNVYTNDFLGLSYEFPKDWAWTKRQWTMKMLHRGAPNLPIQS